LRGRGSFASSASSSSSVGARFGIAPPLAVLNGIAGGPGNGELMIAILGNTSPRISAAHDATGEPASCPAMPATDL
jgi:hypothetical protein